MNTILFSYVPIQYLNGWSSTLDIAHKLTILILNHLKSELQKFGIQMFLVLKWSIFVKYRLETKQFQENVFLYTKHSNSEPIQNPNVLEFRLRMVWLSNHHSKTEKFKMATLA